MIDTTQPRRWRTKEERCKFCGGTPRVFTQPKNWHRKPTDHDVLVHPPTVKVGRDRRGRYRSNRDAVGHFTENFAGDDATGNFAVYDATENFAGYDATGNFAVYDATENFAGDDATGYFAGNDATGYFAGSSSPAERGEKRRW